MNVTPLNVPIVEMQIFQGRTKELLSRTEIRFKKYSWFKKAYIKQEPCKPTQYLVIQCSHFIDIFNLPQFLESYIVLYEWENKLKRNITNTCKEIYEKLENEVWFSKIDTTNDNKIIIIYTKNYNRDLFSYYNGFEVSQRLVEI